MTALPEWMQIPPERMGMKHCYKMQEALAIAWEAIGTYRVLLGRHPEGRIAEEATSRITKLGEE